MLEGVDGDPLVCGVAVENEIFNQNGGVTQARTGCSTLFEVVGAFSIRPALRGGAGVCCATAGSKAPSKPLQVC